MPQSDHLTHLCPILLVRSWSKCAFGQWAAAEATCKQCSEHLLLKSTTVAPSPELCDPEHNVTSCDISLEQHHIDSYNSVVINLPTSTITPLQCVENTTARLVLFWSGSQSPQHTSSEETSLAICPPPYYLQNCYSDAHYTVLYHTSRRSSTFRRRWFQQKSSSVRAATTVRTRRANVCQRRGD